jgi:hypothetical protein
LKDNIVGRIPDRGYGFMYEQAQKESHKNSRILKFYSCTIYANTQTSIPFRFNKLFKIFQLPSLYHGILRTPIQKPERFPLISKQKI